MEDLNDQINYNDKQLGIINDLMQSIKANNKGLINKLKAWINDKEDGQFQEYNKEQQQLLTKQLDLERTKNAKQEEITKNSEKQKSVNQRLTEIKRNLTTINHKVQDFDNYQKDSTFTIPSKEFWNTDNYDERQVSNLWTSDELQYRRAMVFLRSMILHKLLLIANNTTIYYGIKDFKDRRKLIDTKPEVVYNAWNVMHLIFPIVSTTFASFRSMYQGIPQGFIDHLFIDEGTSYSTSSSGCFE